MSSIIPALNEDCVTSILSYLDKSSLVTIACTSKTGKGVALPLLVHTVQLYTEVPEQIISFSRSVLSNQLGHYVRHLKIQHGYVQEDETDPVFLPAMQPLVDLVAATDNLASLRIPVFADDLFKWAPGLVDAINAHPPSQAFEIGSISDRGWQLARPFTGLRDLSLTFDELTEELDIFAITAPSAKTLNSIHLGGCMQENIRISFRQGSIPCEAARMVSFCNAETSPTDLHNAFPNVQFINSSWSNVSAGPSQYGPELLPNLIGLNGQLDTALELAPHHDLCMLRLSEYINTNSEFEQFSGALGAGSARSLRSLSLILMFDNENVDRSDRLSGQLFFSRLPQFAPQLRFADLDITLSYADLDAVPPRDTWDNTIALCRAACRYLARLAHLKFVILNFAPGQENDLTDLLAAFRGIATECLRSLPLADYFALNLLGETTFVTRRRAWRSWT
ncbi:hypothetical protein EWM64_g681 [Hericium alpestre]|uniref:F-box domain-containing protein n=1 Tax=Hericium alpestre TaxID=135208 RepID=A0A4Z0AAI7_9AGAM|nr:hypothetical protein EWM64_g681 [Hericium alpestre]